MDKIYLNFLHEIDTLWDKECAIYNEVGVEREFNLVASRRLSLVEGSLAMFTRKWSLIIYEKYVKELSVFL